MPVFESMAMDSNICVLGWMSWIQIICMVDYMTWIEITIRVITRASWSGLELPGPDWLGANR